MKHFEILDDYLSKEYSPDYWSDDALFYAQELVRQMASADWIILEDSWRTRPKQWQYRCAEVLDAAEPGDGIPVLLEMIQDSDDHLAVTAADSLRSFDLPALGTRLSTDSTERLKAIANRSSRPIALVIDDLLRRVRVES